MEQLDLDWSKLASITTDRAPSMVGTSGGLIGRMDREMEERGLTVLLQIHCLIHQQALCYKVLKWDGCGFMHKLYKSKETYTQAVPTIPV